MRSLRRTGAAIVLALVCTAASVAEPDNGRVFSQWEVPSFTNIFIEGGGGLAFPLTFMTQNFIPMTNRGGQFFGGIGYNWDGWLFGLEYTRDMWGQGTGPGALMNNFNNNLFLFKFQRVLSKNTIHFFPKWLEIVPGISGGVNFITTDYYRSQRAKNEGRESHVTFGTDYAECAFGRASLEASIYLGTDQFIPFVGGDYKVFYDKSIGGGFAGFWTVSAGIRSYPLGFVSDIKRHAAEKAEQARLAAEQERRAAEQQEEAQRAADQQTAEEAAKKRDAELKAHHDLVASWGKAVCAITADPEVDFTPDDDGENDVCTLTPSANYLEYDPESWKIEMLDPKGNPFRTWTGTGKLPAPIPWDGKNDAGTELVFSRDTYTARLTVVPDEKDRVRTRQNSLESEATVQTAILMQEIIPQQEWKIVVNTIFFDPDAATFNKITAAQRQSNKDTLDSVARQIMAHGEVHVVVEGYANNVSNTEREDREELVPLLQARAEAIMKQLEYRGLKAENMSAKGFGGARPLAKWEDRPNWWKNRRVEFRVTK